VLTKPYKRYIRVLLSINPKIHLWMRQLTSTQLTHGGCALTRIDADQSHEAQAHGPWHWNFGLGRVL
jgi:hypothetical protein